MSEFFFTVAIGIVCYMLGHWVATDPADARTYETKVVDAFKRLIAKL
jgi:hypothetical protein